MSRLKKAFDRVLDTMISGLHATPIKNRCPPALHHIAKGIERKRIFTDGVDGDNFLNRLGKL